MGRSGARSQEPSRAADGGSTDAARPAGPEKPPAGGSSMRGPCQSPSPLPSQLLPTAEPLPGAPRTWPEVPSPLWLTGRFSGHPPAPSACGQCAYPPSASTGRCAGTTQQAEGQARLWRCGPKAEGPRGGAHLGPVDPVEAAGSGGCEGGRELSEALLQAQIVAAPPGALREGAGHSPGPPGAGPSGPLTI